MIDGVIFERIRGRNTVNGIQLNMYYGSDASGEGEREEAAAGAEGEAGAAGEEGGAAGAAAAEVTVSHGTPTIRNVMIRDVQISTVTRDAFVIAGLPEMPITGLVLEDIHIEGASAAWNCHRYDQCTWPGGGCAMGVVRDVFPPPPFGCVLSVRRPGAHIRRPRPPRNLPLPPRLGARCAALGSLSLSLSPP